jgi:PKHD-type hydroxylase
VIVHIPRVLGAEDVGRCVQALADAPWTDGRATAGGQAGLAKRNLQLPEDAAEAKALGDLVVKALSSNPVFRSAALPARVYPPQFNRYAEGMTFGDHIDNALRISPVTGARYRTDLSCTLFLSQPDAYEGGELTFDDGFSPRSVKLPAGDMILYSANTVHRVEPVTRGERLACFFWVQSLVADEGQRALLHRLDQAVASVRVDLGDAHPAAVALVGVYHNLIRMWAEA